MPTIAIVGGGLSGALLAWQLVHRGPKGMSIALIEERDRLGLGQAYSTDEPAHLLNIPVGRMTALPGRPAAFADYLAGRDDLPAGDEPLAEAYAPRLTFGQFIGSLVKDALTAHGGPVLQPVHGTAVSLRSGNRHTVILSDGRQISADMVVLALGNLAPRHPEGGGSWLRGSSLYRHDPWAPGALDSVAPEAPVLFLGTGLTMIDCVLTLLRHGHRGQLTAISRHGLLPQHHLPGPRTARDLPFDPENPPGISTLLRAIRARARRAEAEGHDWRGVMDGLRAVAQTTWLHLTVAEQSRFLRHVRPWWEVHRHRLAPEVWRTVEPLLASGRLTVIAARVKRYVPAEGSIEITAAHRTTRAELRLRGSLLVNCTGPAMDIAAVEHTLLRQLTDGGLVAPGPHRLGIDVAPDLSVIDATGQRTRGLYALGPLLRGRYWEITSVPEIGKQAAELAATLVRRHVLA
jgi:uncharacterized NAD(P)/FAD-binding protein YdhS